MTAVGQGELEAFRDAVGAVGAVDAVCVRGGGTHWTVGGGPSDGCREVAAPAGITAFDPAEMTVTAGAGTLLADLAQTLAVDGQEVAVDGPPGSTVGGALAVGRNSLRSARIGSARDALLQADCVGADGRLFTAGGPTVKNVSGYDLCRLLVGSLGTLALMARLTLRTRPAPEQACWMQGPADPSAVRRACHRPATLLWDGERVTVRLEGYGEDVEASADALGTAFGLRPVDGAPALPPYRRRWTGVLPAGGVLLVGTGVVYGHEAAVAPAPPPGVAALAARIRSGFDPTGRLNPGRDPYRVAA